MSAPAAARRWAAAAVIGALALVPGPGLGEETRALVCVPDAVLHWMPSARIETLDAMSGRGGTVTTIDLASGEASQYLSGGGAGATGGGIYAVAHPGDVPGRIDWVGVHPTSGELLQIAVWADPIRFLRVEHGDVETGTCTRETGQ